MCISASQIIYSFIMMPSSLPSSYVRFLNKAAAKEPWVWKAVQVSLEGCSIEKGGLRPKHFICTREKIKILASATKQKTHMITIINLN